MSLNLIDHPEVVLFEVKTCTKCGTIRPISDYYFKDRTRTKRFARCRFCHREAGKAWWADNPERTRGYQLKDRYGISVEDETRMRQEQEGLCKICSRELPLVVDHDHATARVRGLLCRSCNQGLGQFQDDPDRLRAAAEYLS